MLTHAKSPLLLAFCFSLVAHLVLAAYMQYAVHLLDAAPLSTHTPAYDALTVSALLLPNPSLGLPNALPAALPAALKTKANPAAALAPTEPSPHSQTAGAQVPSITTAIPAPQDSEALPHEELARKKEPLLPASLPPKDKPLQYSLPNQIKLGYLGAWGGTPVQGTLQFELKGNDYQASLHLQASVLFKTFELKQSAQGVLSAQGLEVLRAEDKAMNGRVVAMTAEPDKQRVVISSKEGFFPYALGGKDLISVIIQLGVLVQAQSEWQTRGASQDFTVYRPSGIKRWRYQSQGLEKLQLNGATVETVYIKRVAQSSEPDFEYIHHLWLDPARHGMPIRIKLEDAKSGRTIDLTLSQWDEL